ncbi:hypothetical protein QWY82_12640 [Simiduia curdlanivorans]|uniref:Solute-binding protein family 3/N-terminal domain-containing protein n=1 Tax=Simiduia curdlanivorans TaxID=1492769 RepID=A0ABV8V8M3_9GAMM|nr:hypothetical protein [Simiduia curdlanivorans]MDN3639644.1 hypothetical protein [Simiduia curdlanivorans]
MAFGLDVITLPTPQSSLDTRGEYKNEVLYHALQLTVPEYGPYKVNLNGPSMNRKRALLEIQEGRLINVYFAPDDPLWRELTLPILIPIRRGILNYRLLLIHKDNIELFANINTLDELKALKMGAQYDWSTKSYLENYQFTTVTGASYEGLFVMLENKRFDFMLRGVHEIFNEVKEREATMPHLTIEPHLVLYIPTPTYTYVSPRYPRIAKRLQKGLEMMVNNGDLKSIFDRHFSDEIRQAELRGRRILFLEEEHKKQMLRAPKVWFNHELEAP